MCEVKGYGFTFAQNSRFPVSAASRLFSFFLLLFFLFLSSFLLAQPKVITFGIQFKPLVPSRFFRSGEINFGQSNINYSIAPEISFSGGMVIRRGFTKNFSLESGINFVKRNFNLTVENNDASFHSEKRFSIVGYEIPTLGLLYIRLGDQMFMNAAFGISLDFFPSDVGTNDYYYEYDVQVQHVSVRNHNRWLQPSLLANLGYEYRTVKKGYFYFGSSFHRPFAYSYQSNVKYINGSFSERAAAEISGNYLTFDLRYFFHQDPEKPKVKKKEGKTIRYFEELKKKGNKM